MVPRKENDNVVIVEDNSGNRRTFEEKLDMAALENVQENKTSEVRTGDFEEAIAATGYGKFNIFLFLCTLPAFWSSVSVTSSVSYIFSKAKCHMDLSLLDMGTVNGITYGGMISSAMFWGYLSDTLGRRKIMVWGFLASGLIELLAAISQNFAMLLVLRFLAGFLFNGPFAVLLSYIAELHRTEYRARVMLYSCMFYTLANCTLPLLAWATLTHSWQISLFGGRFVIFSWNIFLMITGLVPLFTGLAFAFLPESPKFLMSRGRNQEAIAVFKSIYSSNTGLSKDSYPIKVLAVEKNTNEATGSAALRAGFTQLTPLFNSTHGPNLLLMCLINTGCMFGSNTLRLWFPQLAAMLTTSTSQKLCNVFVTTPRSLVPEEAEVCVPIETDYMTYLQSAIVGAGSIITYGIGGMIINQLGKRTVAGVCCLLFGLSVILLPVLGDGAMVLVSLVTVALALSSLVFASLSSIIVDLFPTSLRVMAMATFLMCGRLGTVSGTVAFPALLDFGCIPPFAAIAVCMFVCGVSCFFVPKTTLKKLE